jgi:phytol kinase
LIWVLTGLPDALIISGVILIGLWLSNFAFDRGVPQYVSRKIGHGAGGLSFLLSLYFFASPWWPICLAFLFGCILLLVRFFRPATFRGVGGAGRSSSSFSEVLFAWTAVPVYLVGWAWCHQPALTVASLLFMAWGDGITGLVRSRMYSGPVKGLRGSWAMLSVCLVISLALIHPFWIGVLASLAATITEWAFGDVGRIKSIDDNLAIPVISLATMLALFLLI